jgi:hypothetical protein
LTTPIMLPSGSVNIVKVTVSNITVGSTAVFPPSSTAFASAPEISGAPKRLINPCDVGVRAARLRD